MACWSALVPLSILYLLHRPCRHTPLIKSKISLMATQNSSKSSLPSLSTSAKSHTLSSWSSRKCEFLSTGAACTPSRWVPPLLSELNISQYFSISSCSMRFGAMLAVGIGSSLSVWVGADGEVWVRRGEIRGCWLGNVGMAELWPRLLGWGT